MGEKVKTDFTELLTKLDKKKEGNDQFVDVVAQVRSIHATVDNAEFLAETYRKL